MWNEHCTAPRCQAVGGLGRFHAYRDDAAGGAYRVRHVGYLRPEERLYLPLAIGGKPLPDWIVSP